MIYYGLEWHSLESYFQMKEITAPGTPQASELRFYTKDKTGVSALYAKDDAGVEHELTNRVGGTGTANRLAYWTSTTALGAVGALTQGWILVADANGLPTGNNSAKINSLAGATQLVIKGTTNGLITIDGDATGNPYLEWAQSGVSKAFLQYVNSDTSLTMSIGGATRSKWVPYTVGAMQFLGGGTGLISNNNGIELVPKAGQASGSIVRGHGYGTGVFMNFQGSHARGTSGSPTATQADDVIARFSGLMYGASQYSAGRVVGIDFFAAENATNTANGTYITFGTTPTGSVTIAERLRIGPAGQIGIGGATYGTSGNLLRSNGSAAAVSWQDHTADFLSQYALLAGRSGGQTLIGGTAASNGLTLQSTSNGTKGKITFGSASAYDEVNDFLGIGTTSPSYKLQLGGTVANNSASHSIAFIGGILSGNSGGAGNEMFSTWMATSFQPSASIGLAAGFRTDIDASPGSGVTISNFMGGRFIYYTGSGAGAITSMTGLELTPVFGTIKPTTSYGLVVSNMGSASITTAACLSLTKPTNATNNYYMVLDTADNTDPTGGGGAATGRVPVLIGGVLRYFPYY